MRLARAAMFVLMFLLTAGFDQGTKQWANHALTPGVPEPVIAGFWDWELAKNDGAAFSALSGGGTPTQVVLAVLAMIMLVAIGVMAARTRPEQRLQRVALALVAGGALGNLIDRVREGAVTDFVRWRWHEHEWPIFNVADVALVIGAALLVAAGWLETRRRRAPA